MNMQLIFNRLTSLHPNRYFLCSQDLKQAIELGYVCVDFYDLDQMKKVELRKFLDQVKFEQTDKGICILGGK